MPSLYYFYYFSPVKKLRSYILVNRYFYLCTILLYCGFTLCCADTFCLILKAFSYLVTVLALLFYRSSQIL
jgi:hypothetical protein